MTFYRFFFGIAILSDLAPKTNHMFHFTGKNQSTPNCPVQLVANFNPGTGSQSFRSSDKNCTKPAQYRLPFYLKDMGPRYNAISVGAHEARPGHHTQVRYLGQFSCCCCLLHIHILKLTSWQCTRNESRKLNVSHVSEVPILDVPESKIISSTHVTRSCRVLNFYGVATFTMFDAGYMMAREMEKWRIKGLNYRTSNAWCSHFECNALKTSRK